MKTINWILYAVFEHKQLEAAAGLIDAADIPLAAVDGLVRASWSIPEPMPVGCILRGRGVTAAGR